MVENNRSIEETVISESVKREIDYLAEGLIIEEYFPAAASILREKLGEEKAKRTVALGIVMTRIICSAHWN